MEGSVILQQGTRKRESEAFQASLSPAEWPRVEAQELGCPDSDTGSASCLSSLGLSYRRFVKIRCYHGKHWKSGWNILRAL